MSALSLTVITTSVSLVSYSSYYFCQPCLLLLLLLMSALSPTPRTYFCQPCLLLLLLLLSALSPPLTASVSLVSSSYFCQLASYSYFYFCQPCLLLPLLLFLFFLLFLLFTSTSAFTLPHTSVNLFPPPPFTFVTCSAELKEED